MNNEEKNLTLFPEENYIKTNPNYSVIPFRINSKYINFMHKAFNTKKTNYVKNEVTAIQIHNTSSFGKYLQLLVVKSKIPVSIKKSDYIFFYINDKGYSSGIYKIKSGRFSLLEVPTDMYKDLTNYIHDYFISSMVNFVDGYYESGKEIMEGVVKFMDKYNLWDHWDKRVLHRQYYREKENGQANRLVFFKK